MHAIPVTPTHTISREPEWKCIHESGGLSRDRIRDTHTHTRQYNLQIVNQEQTCRARGRRANASCRRTKTAR